MSSGNPFGLSEISHFGSFQRVGGKAGGFISKKFFHPSSFRNQEKLWKAQTEDERQKRKQMELEKRREEERQVEELRKQMYLAGQGKATDVLNVGGQFGADDSGKFHKLSSGERTEQAAAIAEQKRRKAQLKEEKRALAQKALERSPGDSEDDEEDEEGEEAADGRVLAKSRYQEDVRILGHGAIWGSWYDKKEGSWGFGCCKVLKRAEQCPLAPEEEPAKGKEEKARPLGDSRRARKRRRQLERQAAEEAAEVGADGGASASAADVADKGRPDGEVAAPVQETVTLESLMDNRMFEAAARRKEQKRLEEQRRQEAKQAEKERSAYLADLCSSPT